MAAGDGGRRAGAAERAGRRTRPGVLRLVDKKSGGRFTEVDEARAIGAALDKRRRLDDEPPAPFQVPAKEGLRGGSRARTSGLSRRGQTLIEFLIMTCMIGLLAAIAIPKFSELIRKSDEGNTKGNLGAVRTAMAVLAKDTGGRYPVHPRSLAFGGKYLPALPKAKPAPYHEGSSRVRLGRDAFDADDSGGWLYLSDRRSPGFGGILVNCTHTDSKERQWTSY